MNKILFLPLGCLIPVWQCICLLCPWWLGRTRQIAAHSHTPRRSFPILASRRASVRKSARHPFRIRAPRVRFPGIATPRNAHNHSDETKRLPWLRPPLQPRTTPLLASAQRRLLPSHTNPTRKENILAEAGFVFPPQTRLHLCLDQRQWQRKWQRRTEHCLRPSPRNAAGAQA